MKKVLKNKNLKLVAMLMFSIFFSIFIIDNSFSGQYVGNGGTYIFDNDFENYADQSIRKNQTEVISVNVSCDNTGNCGTLNVSLHENNISNIVFEDFESGFGSLTADGGSCTWVRDQDVTPSDTTGPGGTNSAGNGYDHTLGTTTGWFVYVEASSSACQGGDTQAVLTGTSFEAGSISTNLTFWYHMFGNNMGTLHVDIFDGSSWNNDVFTLVGSRQATGSDPFLQANIDLSNYSGTINYRFRYDGVTGWSSDASLDDIQVITNGKLLTNFSSTPFEIEGSMEKQVTLNQNQWELINFTINATGEVGNETIIYAKTIKDSDSTIKSLSFNKKLIVSDANPPTGNLLTPNNGTTVTTASVTFNSNATDDFGLSTATLYVWNSSNALIGNSSRSLGDVLSSTFAIEFNFTKAGNYTWNVEVVDIGGNKAFIGNSNYSINVDPAKVILEYQNIVNPYPIKRGEFTRFDINISCINGDCYNINTTLYALLNSPPVTILDVDLESGFETLTADAGTCTWALDQAGTPSGQTGPNVDNTLGTVSGWYAYVETSTGGTTPPYDCFSGDNEAILTSANFTTGSSQTNLTFWYHMFGSAAGEMGDLRVDIYNGSEWINDVWFVSGDQQGTQGDAYIQANIDLSSYSEEIQFRIRYNNMASYRGDIAIDDIQIITKDYGFVELPTLTNNIWTNSSNPNSVYLEEGESTIISYFINATGNINDLIETYAQSIITSFNGINAIGDKFNFTLQDIELPYGNKTNPNNGTITEFNTTILEVNANHRWGLGKVTYYIYNSLNSLINTTEINLSGELSNNVQFNYTFPYDDIFEWSVEIEDEYGSSIFADNGTRWEVTKVTRNANITVNIIEPNPAATKVVYINNSFILNTTLNCSTVLESNCGNITAYLQYNITDPTFANVSTISNIPFWTTNINPQVCNLNDGESCNLIWNVNATGNFSEDYKLRVFTTSDSSFVENKTSQNLTVDISDGITITFNVSSLDFGDITRYNGSKNKTIGIISPIGNNTNVQVNCISGDCSRITTNFSNGINVNEFETKSITFSCPDFPIGNYLANYQVSSNEDSSPYSMILTCDVVYPKGPLNMTLVTPESSEILEIVQDFTDIIRTNVSCLGDCQNVSAVLKYPSKYGDGSDGHLNVTTLDTIVNDYTYLTADETISDSNIVVNDASDFAIGDEILIIQMQNGTGIGKSGNYEYRDIVNKIGSTLILDSNLENNYGSGSFNTTLSSVTQIVRVPNYLDVYVNLGASITSPNWDGFTGGIVIFKARGEVYVEGSIETTGKGFRGGDGVSGTGGNNGESFDGKRGSGGGTNSVGTFGGGTGNSNTGTSTGNRGGGGGGGYDGASQTSEGAGGGAGGGHAGGGGGGGAGAENAANTAPSGSGGDGGSTGVSAGGGGSSADNTAGGQGGDAGSAGGSSGGAAGGAAGSGLTTGGGGRTDGAADTAAGGGGGGGYYAVTNLSKIFFGSGGGAGGSSNENSAVGDDGGDGGGIIMIDSRAIKLYSGGTILATGEDATQGGPVTAPSGGGGAGAGGTIFLRGDYFDFNSGSVTAIGGAAAVGIVGGTGNNAAPGAGGGGGIGVIRLDYNNLTGTTTPNAQFSSKVIEYSMEKVSDTTGDVPFYTLNNNPLTCMPNYDGSCLFEWEINATGPTNTFYNLTVEAYSSYGNILNVTSENISVNIIEPYPDVPEITLINPINNKKIISDGIVELEWKIKDIDSPTLNCEIFIDNISTANVSCVNKEISNYANVTIIGGGIKSWYINATDPTNLTNVSSVESFIPIYNKHISIQKNINNVGTNAYLISLKLNNQLNNSLNTIPFEFAHNSTNAGSFSPFWDNNTLVNGIYTGTVYYWNLTLPPLSLIEINYSLAGIGSDYEIKENFITSLD